jgi:hypothetical protein
MSDDVELTARQRAEARFFGQIKHLEGTLIMHPRGGWTADNKTREYAIEKLPGEVCDWLALRGLRAHLTASEYPDEAFNLLAQGILPASRSPGNGSSPDPNYWSQAIVEVLMHETGMTEDQAEAEIGAWNRTRLAQARQDPAVVKVHAHLAGKTTGLKHLVVGNGEA